MSYRNQLGWLAIWLALMLSPGCAEAERDEPATAGPDDYRRYASAEALQRAQREGAAEVLRAAFGKLPRGYPVVCGTVRVNDEEVSFATLWRPGEPVEEGATVVAMTRENVARYGDAFAVQNAWVCDEAGLSEALPRGLGAP